MSHFSSDEQNAADWREVAQMRAVCGRLMVGPGTDTYDPVCELPEGHEGPCRSTAAIDQFRLSEAEKQEAYQ